MNRAHSYAQIPASETQSNPTGGHHQIPSSTTAPQSQSPSPSRHGSSSTRSRGYDALNADEDDDEDEFEEADEDTVMLRHPPAGPSSASAPRRALYPEDEISIAQEQPISSLSSSTSRNGAQQLSSPTQPSPRHNNGARTTNVSFLARITGRQRPGTEARRMIQSTMDGVFSNLSAKPRVEKPVEEELPPSYKSAALDVSPAYYESTLMAPGFSDEDELLIEGLPVGGMFGFMWNVIISMSFQFVGFFLTYLLHTSHATKNGSKTGLGMTFISMGFQMMTGNYPPSTSPSDEEDEIDLDTGYVTPPGVGGAGGQSDPGSLSSLRSIAEYTWLSYFLLTLGGLIVVQSLWEFAKAKKQELLMIAANEPSTGRSTSSRDAEETVPASLAAGYELSSIVSSSGSSISGSGSGAGSTSVQGMRVPLTANEPMV
ncbi:hypothetical protein BGZ83_005711 [Gryganskiella cystojenkinii]|nr:hypothetical protein BGZ83_005711 [Gryganskiella cystojenkinii]